MLVSDLIKRSMRMANILEPGEEMEDDEGVDALDTLNELMDSFNTEQLMIYRVVRETVTLSASTATYTIYDGGTFDIVRPDRIEYAAVLMGSLEVPIKVFKSIDEWNAVPLKSTTAIYPDKIYYDPAFPQGIINVHPVPTGTVSMILGLWEPIAQFTGLDQTIALPRGFSRMLRYNLAVDLCDEYNTKPRPGIEQRAMESKALIKSLNIKPGYSVIDPTLLGMGNYDIYSDQ